ncbi:MAG TPA: hypothetical protein DEP45_00325 [Armatimonadetes bacterium]|nr:hypothetical protein [Armatimonadota bacterium]
MPELNLRHVTWAVFLYSGAMAAAWPKQTYDIWWHLATGRWMIENRRVPHEDPFTWTCLGKKWIAHEWGWELPSYLMYAHWGHDGLLALRVMVALITCGLLAWLCLRRRPAPLAAIAAGGLAVFAARAMFNDRPQLVTMPLFVAMLCLIEKLDEGKPRWLLIGAPLLMLVWVNVHGGFIYGFALIGLYSICQLPQWIRQYRAQQPLAPCPGVLAATLLLAAAACLANPNGIAGATYPLDYIFGDTAWHTSWISEYQSPDFSDGIFVALGLLIVASMAAFAASGRRSRLWDVAVMALFLWTALKWQRNMAFLSFVVVAPLSLHLSDLLHHAGLAPSQERPDERNPAIFYWAIILALTGSAIVTIPTAARQADSSFLRDMPVKCTEYIAEHHLPGRMFNTYHWGGYLIWHLWPEQKPMVDGRADVLGQPLVKDWRRAHRMEEGWEEVLDRYEIDYVLISDEAGLHGGLKKDPAWRMVCSDPGGSLFVRKGSAADEAASEGVAEP